MRPGFWFALASALGAAAASRLYRRYRRDMRTISDNLGAASQIACTARGPIEYERHGIGRPVLVVHGAGGGFDQGLAVGHWILDEGYSIIAPSRFGYLGTPVPEDGSPAAQAEAHAGLLDALDIRKAVVIGVSAGAPSAIEMAIRHPDRVAALILLVPRAYSTESGLSQAPLESKHVLAAVQNGSDFAFWCAIRVARASVVRFLGVRPEVETAASPEERARVTEIMRTILPVSRRIAGVCNDGAAVIGPWPLERIKAPTLVISAADDLFGTLGCARFTAARIPGAELMELETGGHLMVGRTGQVRARVAAFLQRIERVPAKAA
jgi:pimeloyl-ACP methyl ester carboxylesterase